MALRAWERGRLARIRREASDFGMVLDSSAAREAQVGAATVARRVDAGDDRTAMGLALGEARLAAAAGEVPVGAVVVRDGEVVGRGHNRRESWGDPMAHAEMIALAQAAARQQGWRLEGCTVYVTLEPCAMCAGAMVLARVDRLVFGARDPKGGYCGSIGNLVREPRLNHRITVCSGVLAEESSALLRAFFRRLRSSGLFD